jgi:hypothetical protein
MGANWHVFGNRNWSPTHTNDDDDLPSLITKRWGGREGGRTYTQCKLRRGMRRCDPIFLVAFACSLFVPTLSLPFCFFFFCWLALTRDTSHNTHVAVRLRICSMFIFCHMGARLVLWKKEVERLFSLSLASPRSLLLFASEHIFNIENCSRRW